MKIPLSDFKQLLPRRVWQESSQMLSISTLKEPKLPRNCLCFTIASKWKKGCELLFKYRLFKLKNLEKCNLSPGVNCWKAIRAAPGQLLPEGEQQKGKKFRGFEKKRPIWDVREKLKSQKVIYDGSFLWHLYNRRWKAIRIPTRKS